MESRPWATPVGSRRTFTEAMAGQLIRLIIDGHFKPGDQLPTEGELAQQFQVGRGSVREALKALEVIGLTRVERGRGTFVCEPYEFLARPIALGINPHAEIKSLIQARSLIEVKLAALAGDQAQPADIQIIDLYVARMRDARDRDQIAAFLEADMAFHFAIATAAHNSILSQFLMLIRGLVQEWISKNLSIIGVMDEAFDEHLAILKAIKARRSIAAARAMKRHLDNRAKAIEINSR